MKNIKICCIIKTYSKKNKFKKIKNFYKFLKKNNKIFLKIKIKKKKNKFKKIKK